MLVLPLSIIFPKICICPKCGRSAVTNEASFLEAVGKKNHPWTGIQG